MKILLFAQIKDAVGTAELDLNISGSPDAAALWRALIAVQPKLAPFQTSTRLARNGEYADAKTIFSDADEVALIPPVSGG
jgi:molybdopterin synthase catalytic subunit